MCNCISRRGHAADRGGAHASPRRAAARFAAHASRLHTSPHRETDSSSARCVPITMYLFSVPIASSDPK